MALDYIAGKDLNIYFLNNGIPEGILHSTDCKVKFIADIQETTTKNGLKGKTFEYTGKYTYTLEVNGFTNLMDAANFSTFQDAIMQSLKFPFIFTDDNNVIYSGQVLITENDIDSPFGAISSFTLLLQGDGEITKTIQNVPPSPPGATVQIIDQFGNVIAVVPAPGTYAVLKFDTIDQGDAYGVPETIIIIEAA